MKITPEQYKRTVDLYDKWTRPLDESLYKLCQKYPHHGDHSGVAAKCWIIGRTYATGIERQITSNGNQGDSMSRLVEKLVQRAGAIDKMTDRLRSIEAPLTSDSLATIVDVHGQFVKQLSDVVRPEETPRSFTAKYLHFHCPLVPIYDSVVARAIPGFVRWHNNLMVFPMPRNAEEEYAWFCYRFWALYQQARTDLGKQVCVRMLDYHLCCSRTASHDGE